MERSVLQLNACTPPSSSFHLSPPIRCTTATSKPSAQNHAASSRHNLDAYRQSRQRLRLDRLALAHRPHSFLGGRGCHRACRREKTDFGIVAAGKSAATELTSENDLPPASREEAVLQAGASLRSLLDKPLRDFGPATVKQKKARRQVRLRVDIPLLDDSSEALFALAVDLTNAFRDAKTVEGRVGVYVPEDLLPSRPAEEGEERIASFLSLESRERFFGDAVVAIVVAPSFERVSDLEFLTRSAGGRPVVVVNPEWSEDEERSGVWGSFLSSFSVAYSYVPLNVKGFFSTTEGAVLKHVKSGAPEGRPWLIFVKEGGKFKSVSSLKKRPTPADLENALYSSIAMNSPVNKSIMFVRGLIGK